MFAQDTTFSVIVTALFLRPIFKVLGEGDASVQHSASRKSLLKTKWMTLLGASLAVVSSTALYINTGMFFVLGRIGMPFWTNPYLNVFVFGMNLDSVLNDIGMLLVCGVLKKIDGPSLVNCIQSVRLFLVNFFRNFRAFLGRCWLKCHHVDQRQLEAAELYCDGLKANANGTAGATVVPLPPQQPAAA